MFLVASDSGMTTAGFGAEFRRKRGVAPENYTRDEWGDTGCAAYCYDRYDYGI